MPSERSNREGNEVALKAQAGKTVAILSYNASGWNA
jgi:hypothetical protein